MVLSVNLRDVEVLELGLVLAFIDSAPDVGVPLLEVLDAVAVAQAVVREDRLGDVDRVLLDWKSGVVERLGVLHRDETGEYGDIGLAGEDVGAAFEGLGLAVVPPHALFGIDQHEVAFLQEGDGRVGELLHGLEVR